MSLETLRMLELPPSWRVSTNYILEKYSHARILLIGASDTGKSTYCRFLLRTLVGAGRQVSFVDADIGQKDLGPPATISLGILNENGISLNPAPSGLYFVGSVNPRGNFLPMIVGTREMIDLASTPLTVINTTGFIDGNGRALKAYKIETVRPQVIIAIQHDRELESLLEEFSYVDIIRLKPSKLAHGKSPTFRADARRQAFARYFKNSQSITLAKNHFIIQRRDDQSLLGRLCGLASSDGKCLGLALVRNVSADGIDLISPITVRKIPIIQLGSLWFSPDWNETNRITS